MAIASGWGLVRPARLVNALQFLAFVKGCVVAVRLLGISADGVTPLQLTELRDEGLSWLLFLAALAACPRRSRADLAGD